MTGQHVLTLAFKEVIDRLTGGQYPGGVESLLVQGGILDGVNVQPMLPVDQVTQSLTPYVSLWPERSGDSAVQQFVGRQAIAFVDMTILLFEDSQYGYYNADFTRGLFPLLEKVQDAIQSATDGSGVDLTGTNNWLEPPKIELKGYMPLQMPDGIIGFGVGVRVFTPIYDKGSLTI